MEHIENILLPRALMMGVNYDLFWTLNPKSLSPFIRAFELKQEYDDTMLWQSGLYIRLAIASLLDKSVKYPTKPLSSSSKVVDEKMIEDKKMNNIKESFMTHMVLINNNFTKEGLPSE